MMDIKERLREFKSVPGFVCPAEFWAAVNCDSDARYVGIWWATDADDAEWADGRDGLVSADSWAVYLALLDYNFPPGHAAHWLLGNADTPATMRLVIDRRTEWAWLVPFDEAWDVLALQHPAEMTLDEVVAALDAWPAPTTTASAKSVTIDWMGELNRAMAQKSITRLAFDAALACRTQTRAAMQVAG